MLATLIASVVSGEASEAIGRTRRMLVAYLLAGCLALCGGAFLLFAGFVLASRELGVIPAALWFAGGFFAVAIIVLVAHRVSARVKARRVARRRKTEVKAVVSAAAIAAIPALLAGRGRAARLLVPALAALGYAIYHEYRKRPRDPAS